MKISIKEAIERHPNLTTHGLERIKDNPRYESYRLSLLKSENEEIINECIDWIERRLVKAGRDNYICSYDLKLLIEKELGKYVANGQVIVAILALGLEYKDANPKFHPYIFINYKVKKLPKKKKTDQE